jgi:outer membrane receptor for ferric coprogen and ferric-rhodotorulic acid
MTLNLTPLRQASHVLRIAVALVAGLATVSVNHAQGVPPPAPGTGTAKEDEPVILEAFEVVMTQDKGYFSPYSGSALKTNEEIMKVPQSITVLTRDMIDDIASVDLSDMLNYIGIGNFQQGDSAYVRGNNANLNTDGAGDGSPSMAPDAATIDSITVVRGPIAVLYGGNSSVTGAVVRQTRVPTGKRQTMVRAQVDEWGFHRAELDVTGPMGRIGAARFSYRLDLAYQDGDTFLRNFGSRRGIAFGVVQMQYKNTTLRVNAQHQDIRQPFHKTTVMTPEGLPWLGAGRDESLTDRKSHVRSSTNQVRGSWVQRFSPGWSMTMYGTISHYRYGPQSVLLVDQVNYQREVVRMYARRNNGGVDSYNSGADVNGVYKLLGRELRTSFGGVAWTSSRNPYDHYGNPDFGSQNSHLGTAVRSSATALGFDRLEIPFARVRSVMDNLNHVAAEQYRFNPTTNIGTRVATTETNAYLQQNVELIPNRLVVTGALSEIRNRARSRNYTVQSMARPTYTHNRRTLHRAGVVINLTKNIALYGVESRTVVFLNSTSRLEDGSFIPPRDGEMREGGVKASLWDNRLTVTAALYSTYYKNWAVSRTGGITPGYTWNVFDLIRDSYIKGWDASLAMRLVPGWQLMFNITQQDPRIQVTNTRLPSSNRGSWGVFTSYQFTAEPLKKFRVGGGANRFNDRITSGSSMVLPNGRLASTLYPGGQIPLQDAVMTTGFVEYQLNRRWHLKLNVNNVLDEVMVMGAQHAAGIDPSQPRTFSLIATVRF